MTQFTGRLNRSPEFLQRAVCFDWSDPSSPLHVQPTVQFIGRRINHAFGSAIRSSHRQSQVILPALDRANALTEVSSNLLPRSQNLAITPIGLHEVRPCLAVH